MHSPLTTFVEKRQHKRYQLSAIVNFKWETPDGVTHTSAGQTRDITASAVFILTPQLLPVGGSICLKVSLPSLQDDGSGAELRTHGHVVRSDRGGFAVIGETGFQMKFSETQGASADWRGGRKDETGRRGQERRASH